MNHVGTSQAKLKLRDQNDIYYRDRSLQLKKLKTLKKSCGEIDKNLLENCFSDSDVTLKALNRKSTLDEENKKVKKHLLHLDYEKILRRLQSNFTPKFLRNFKDVNFNKDQLRVWLSNNNNLFDIFNDHLFDEEANKSLFKNLVLIDSSHFKELDGTLLNKNDSVVTLGQANCFQNIMKTMINERYFFPAVVSITVKEETTLDVLRNVKIEINIVEENIEIIHHRPIKMLSRDALIKINSNIYLHDSNNNLVSSCSFKPDTTSVVASESIINENGNCSFNQTILPMIQDFQLKSRIQNIPNFNNKRIQEIPLQTFYFCTKVHICDLVALLD